MLLSDEGGEVSDWSAIQRVLCCSSRSSVCCMENFQNGLADFLVTPWSSVLWLDAMLFSGLMLRLTSLMYCQKTTTGHTAPPSQWKAVSRSTNKPQIIALSVHWWTQGLTPSMWTQNHPNIYCMIKAKLKAALTSYVRLCSAARPRTRIVMSGSWNTVHAEGMWRDCRSISDWKRGVRPWSLQRCYLFTLQLRTQRMFFPSSGCQMPCSLILTSQFGDSFWQTGLWRIAHKILLLVRKILQPAMTLLPTKIIAHNGVCSRCAQRAVLIFVREWYTPLHTAKRKACNQMKKKCTTCEQFFDEKAPGLFCLILSSDELSLHLWLVETEWIDILNMADLWDIVSGVVNLSSNDENIPRAHPNLTPGRSPCHTGILARHIKRPLQACFSVSQLMFVSSRILPMPPGDLFRSPPNSPGCKSLRKNRTP